MSSSSSRLTVPPDNKKVCQLYFGKSPVGSEANTWKCTCGTVCKQNIKLGYTNLMSHSKQKHPNYLEMFHLAQQAHGDSKSETASVITRTGQSDESVSGQTTLEYMLDSRSTNVFKWLEWIVMGELEVDLLQKKSSPEAIRNCNRSLSKLSRNIRSSWWRRWKRIYLSRSLLLPLSLLCLMAGLRIQHTLLAFLLSTLARSILLILKLIC